MRAEFEKRLFIGIPAGQEILPILSNIQSSIEHDPEQIRWALPENIHMTLFFLGNVPIDNIPKLTNALKEIVDIYHFRASIEKTGIFPSTRNPKIFWLGVGNGLKKMSVLHEKVKKAVAPFKEGKKNEGFSPHITIGRAAQSYGKIDVFPFLEYVYSPRELDINSVDLYESHLLPHGAEYKVLTTFPLN